MFNFILVTVNNYRFSLVFIIDFFFLVCYLIGIVSQFTKQAIICRKSLIYCLFKPVFHFILITKGHYTRSYIFSVYSLFEQSLDFTLIWFLKIITWNLSLKCVKIIFHIFWLIEIVACSFLAITEYNNNCNELSLKTNDPELCVAKSYRTNLINIIYILKIMVFKDFVNYYYLLCFAVEISFFFEIVLQFIKLFVSCLYLTILTFKIDKNNKNIRKTCFFFSFLLFIISLTIIIHNSCKSEFTCKL